MYLRGLPIQNLFDYCVQNGMQNYETKEQHGLIVSVPAKFSKTDAEYDDHYLPCRFEACHTLENLNGSYISEESMTKALPSFAEKPILASIIEVQTKDATTLDFNGHDMVVAQDKMNPENERIEYVEKIVGIVPKDNNIELVKDENSDKKYVHVDGLVFREYSYAADILEKRGSVDVSVELNVKKFSFDSKNKRLSIDEFTFFGVTLLGAHVKPGMEGAKATVQTFDKNNDYDELKSILSEFQSLLSEYRMHTEKGGYENLKLQELLEKYNKTEQDITFETEGLNDEELEKAFADAFEEGDPEPEPASDPEPQPEPQPEPEPTDFENKVISYEISHDDIRNGLYTLLRESVEESKYYDVWIVEVFESYFVYEDYTDGMKYYRQGYMVEGENIAFEGDKVEVFAEFITADEKAALDLMKATYNELKQFKEDFDNNAVKAEKEAVLNNEKFSVLANDSNFQALIADMDKYTVAEVQDKAKAIFSEFVYENPNAIIELEERKTGKINLPAKTGKKNKRYGNLFD